jgi:cytoskeletal protein CcmA (bactofilin family)
MMFQRKHPEDRNLSAGNQTVIAQGVRVEGDFVSEGDVVIEGDVIGSVKTAKHLRVGEAAHIQADVSAADAVVAGQVRGNLVVTGTLELLEASQVSGDIEAAVLSVSPGAKVNGRVTMDGDKGSGRTEEKRRGGKRVEAPEQTDAVHETSVSGA